MTSLAMRPGEAAPPEYRRFLSSGAWAIAVVAGFVVVWAVLAFAALSVAIGAAALAFGALVVTIDAMFATPTRIDATASGLTVGWWARDKSYAPDALLLVHDVRRDRFTLRSRGRFGRVLARFRDDDASEVTRAFMAAGVEIVTH